MIFEGRQLASLNAWRIETIVGDDADPNEIVTSTAVSGNQVAFTLTPDAGCASAGCREGRWYQLCAQPEDSGGFRPWGCGCVEIRRERFSRPR